MTTFKANRTAAIVVVLTALGSCGLAATASAQSLTIPGNTDGRAFEPPIDVTPGQLLAQDLYARPGVPVRRSATGSNGFVAIAPGYEYDGER